MSGRWLRMAAELEARGHGQYGQNGQKSEDAGVLSNLSVLAASTTAPTAKSGPDTSAALDAFEERVAIVEYDSGIPRAWAEGFARMQLGPCPDWCLRPKLWADLIDAAGRFLDEWGVRAAGLGWTPVDLFGALPAAPLARLDQQGLVFFLQDGGQVTAMTADTAVIKRRSGGVQTFRRRPVATRHPRTAPVWELVDDANHRD